MLHIINDEHWAIVLRWRGWSGLLSRYNWAISGDRWPTIHAGPLVVHTGPSPYR